MNSKLKQRTGIAILAGFLCVAMVFLAGAAPKSAGKAATKFEYTTVSTDMKSLPTELNKLGKDGWNVVSAIRDDLILSQEDGKNHIRTAQVTIVAKRRQK
jgi:hypothetical protein